MGKQRKEEEKRKVKQELDELRRKKKEKEYLKERKSELEEEEKKYGSFIQAKKIIDREYLGKGLPLP